MGTHVGHSTPHMSLRTCVGHICAYDHGGMDVGSVAGVVSPLWHGWLLLVMHAEHMPTPVVGAREVCELGRGACHCRVFIAL